MDGHAQAVSFSLGAVAKKTAPACVTAVIARAYYHVEEGQLVRFCQALADGVPADDARAIDKVARLLKAQIELGGQTNDSLTMLYRKGQNALASWIAGRQLQRLHAVEEDLYPLPKDAAALAS